MPEEKITLERNGYTTEITLESHGVAHDRWGKFLKKGDGKWQEQWSPGNFPIWREQKEE